MKRRGTNENAAPPPLVHLDEFTGTTIFIAIRSNSDRSNVLSLT